MASGPSKVCANQCPCGALRLSHLADGTRRALRFWLEIGPNNRDGSLRIGIWALSRQLEFAATRGKQDSQLATQQPAVQVLCFAHIRGDVKAVLQTCVPGATHGLPEFRVIQQSP